MGRFSLLNIIADLKYSLFSENCQLPKIPLVAVLATGICIAPSTNSRAPPATYRQEATIQPSSSTGRLGYCLHTALQSRHPLRFCKICLSKMVPPIIIQSRYRWQDLWMSQSDVVSVGGGVGCMVRRPKVDQTTADVQAKIGTNANCRI